MKTNIFLVGFMASGKSSLGKKLASRLNYNFFDLDEEIEKVEHNTINEIFVQYGEEYFRQKEYSILKKIVENNPKNAVIALGGGAFCEQKNIEFVKSSGWSVFLFLELKNLIGRLKANKDNRPLVKDLEEDELIKKISKLLKKRERFYEQAHLKLEAKNSKSKLIKEIMAFVESQR